MSDSSPDFVDLGSGSAARRIAVRARPGGPPGASAPGLFWMSGFKSDMRGIKAQALAAWAAEQGRACVRFDYSGHGESTGKLEDGTIGRWLEESRAVFGRFCRGPQVVVGSSMGGWLALLLARAVKQSASPASLAGLVLIAPAVDFTEVLIWQKLPRAAKRDLEETGAWTRPSAYSDEPYVI